MSKIYYLGNTSAYGQAAQRADGQWFVRYKTTWGIHKVWGKWKPAAEPSAKFEVPHSGKARLPK